MNCVTLVFLCAAAAPSPAPSTSSPPLLLSEVLTDVEAQSPAIGAQRARAASLALTADAAGFWDDPFLAVGPDEVSLSDRMPVIRFQLSQVIPLGGKRAARADAVRADANSAARDIDVTTRMLRVAATQMFLRARYLGEAQKTNALLQQALHEVQASAAARYMAGGGAHHEALLADAELAVLQRDAIQLDRSLQAVMINLAALRGLTVVNLGPAPPLVDDVTFMVAPTFDDAITQQPELQAARARVDAASAYATAQSLAVWPDLSVQLMAMQSFMDDEPSNVGGMVGISLPMYFPWKQGRAAEASARNVDAQHANLELLLLGLRTEWEQAHRDLQSATETATLYAEKLLPATKLALESSTTAYATREAPLVEVLAVIRAYHQAALEAEAAQIDVHLAHLRLAELLAQGPVMQLAPSSPTLFGGGAMGGMNKAMPSMGSMPVRMGVGMTAPAAGLINSDEAASGMGGM